MPEAAFEAAAGEACSEGRGVELEGDGGADSCATAGESRLRQMDKIAINFMR